MRTRFGRLCATRSGQEAVLDDMTERDRWIYTSFQFLRPHIVRCPSRQSKVKVIFGVLSYLPIGTLSIKLAHNIFYVYLTKYFQ